MRWKVTLEETGDEVGEVSAPTHVEALGAAIAMVSHDPRGFRPQRLLLTPLDLTKPETLTEHLRDKQHKRRRRTKW